MSEISNLISSVGFPIVACVFMYKQQLELTKTINDLSTTLKGIDVRISEMEREEK